MITPFYMLILVPVVFLQAPGLHFSLGLACVPIVNLTLMIREILTGTFQWLPIGVSFLVSLLLIGLCLRLATYMLQFEDVITGSYGGSFASFFKERVLGSTGAAARKGTGAEVIDCAAAPPEHPALRWRVASPSPRPQSSAWPRH